MRFCLVHIAAGLAISMLRDALSSWLLNTIYGASYSLYGIGSALYHFLHYAMFLAMFNGFFFYREYRRRQVLTSQLETQLARSQLKLLRMQLQPHFLFNTLNTIASLNLHDVKAANRMISRLSDLLRISLADMGRQEVPLRKEVDFLKRYLEIEQIRFGDRLAVDMDIPPGLLEAHVPNLILQPIVENAVRHGIQRTASPGRITIVARRRGGDLVVEIGDNGPGFDGHRPPASQQLGLSNTRERLAKMYGGAAALEVGGNATGGNSTDGNNEGGNDAGDHDVKGALVRLTLPFHTAPIGGDSAESAVSAETAKSEDEASHE
jgi:sensor histidine kinase YesM